MSAAVRKVLVVDDHPVVREGITLLFAGQPDLQGCRSAIDVRSALQAAQEPKPDVALIDLALGPGSGLELIALLTESADHCSAACNPGEPKRRVSSWLLMTRRLPRGRFGAILHESRKQRFFVRQHENGEM